MIFSLEGEQNFNAQSSEMDNFMTSFSHFFFKSQLTFTAHEHSFVFPGHLKTPFASTNFQGKSYN
jgi:hypothetical protein